MTTSKKKFEMIPVKKSRKGLTGSVVLYKNIKGKGDTGLVISEASESLTKNTEKADYLTIIRTPVDMRTQRFGTSIIRRDSVVRVMKMSEIFTFWERFKILFSL